MTEAKKLTPNAIANQMMADEAWHDTLYVRAEIYDLLEAENERLRAALLRIRETKVFLGAIAQEMMDDALRQEEP